jgi:hypothetical protein
VQYPHFVLTCHEYAFIRDFEIIDFWGLGGPVGPKNHSKRSGVSPPTVWNGLRGLPGPPGPQTSMISGSLINRCSCLY